MLVRDGPPTPRRQVRKNKSAVESSQDTVETTVVSPTIVSIRQQDLVETD